MRAAEALAVAGVVMGIAAAARADGAFPAGEAVLVPADNPQEIFLVTNFGVVLSEDGGATWSWSCEQDANALGTFYQLGPAPAGDCSRSRTSRSSIPTTRPAAGRSQGGFSRARR